jgi:hypothetical protein
MNPTEEILENPLVNEWISQGLPNPTILFVTRGVDSMFSIEELGELPSIVFMEYNDQLDECLDGGNDKRFFSFKFNNIELWAEENEIGGLTILLPEEH